ncbi:recombinase family protein [Sphingobium rhizovicinum]|uniref:Recombinase family protein n=1 Tax=Sphingobium rhizovicinum TaxID=432308 RepID=A0ABV7NID7_9SPHN
MRLLLRALVRARISSSTSSVRLPVRQRRETTTHLNHRNWNRNMTATAIYGRYSTELQSETSLIDQERFNRRFIKRMEWQSPIVVYSDRAISGASRLNRPGFLKMLDDMKAGRISRIVVENLSRLTRDLEDSSHLMKQAKFRGVKIFCANENGAELTKMNAAINALMAEQAREQGAEMIRRGMTGVVLAGKSAGGRSYGYRSLPRLDIEKGKGGRIEIVPHEADIVREIFIRYIAGESPKAIAADLNRRGVPSPRASLKGKNGFNTGLWSDSTINGNRARGTGILHNALYAGRRNWNRVGMPKNPDTARRVSRANDESDWISVKIDDTLRIVSDEVFAAAQTRKEERSFKQTKRQAQRPKRLFSGLLRCGCCGLSVNSAGWDKNDRLRVKCSGKTSRGVCGDPVGCYIEDIENVVMSALRKHLAAPMMRQAYIDEYMAERHRFASSAGNDHEAIAKQLAALTAQMDRARKWAREGITDEADFERDYPPLVAERAALEAKLSATAAPAAAPSFHPVAVARFTSALDGLTDVLCEDGSQPSAQMIRAVVDQIVVTPLAEKPSNPFERRQISVEILGGLDALLSRKAGWSSTTTLVGEGVGSGGGT